MALGKRLSVSLTGSAGHNTFPEDPHSTYNGLLAGGNVTYRLPGNLITSATYTYWRRQVIDTPAVLTNNTSITVSYGKSWRR
jgi:hypothetical protein